MFKTISPWREAGNSLYDLQSTCFLNSFPAQLEILKGTNDKSLHFAQISCDRTLGSEGDNLTPP